MDKKELRKKYLDIRNSLARKSGDAVLAGAAAFEKYNRAKTVFCYVSAGSEADTKKLLSDILGCGKTLAVPRCIDKNGNMEAVKIKSLSELKKGAFGISEPTGGEVIDKKDIDLAFVPGIAFDKSGFRLGYGGGFYDRYLENSGIYSIGVCFEELFVSKLPTDENDQKVNALIIINKEGEFKNEIF